MYRCPICINYLNNSVTTCGYSISEFTRGVWYLLPGDDRCYTVSTEGSDFDTVLAVYSTTTGCEPLSCMDGNDDYNGLTSKLNLISTTNGTNYFVLVAGYFEATGDYIFTVEVSYVCAILSLFWRSMS